MSKSKKRKKTEKPKTTEKKYNGIWGMFLKLIEVESTTQKILKFILAVIIIPIIYWIVSDIYSNYQEKEIIEQKISQANNYYDSEQYEQAYKEYNEILKSFNENEHPENYANLLNKIGLSLISQKPNVSKLKESILFFKNAEKRLKRNSEEYFYNQLSLQNAYFNLFEINPRKEYLLEIKLLLDATKPHNNILKGLKDFFSERYYQSKYIFTQKKLDIDSSMFYIEKSLEIFNYKNSSNLNAALINDKGNNFIEYYHINKSREDIISAKENYQVNYERTNIENDKIGYAISLFGLAHSYSHLYEKDSVSEYIFKAKDLIIQSNNLYDKTTNPINYYSSLVTKAKIYNQLGILEKDENRFNESILNYLEVFEFYTPNYFENEFYGSKYNLAVTYFEYYQLEKNILHLKKSINILESISGYFKYESNPKNNANVIGLLGANYYLLSQIENKKINQEKKLRLLTLPKSSLVSTELTDKELIDLGKKLSSYNDVAYLRTKEESFLFNANLYRVMGDENSTAELRKEAYNLVSTIQDVMSKVPTKNE